MRKQEGKARDPDIGASLVQDVPEREFSGHESLAQIFHNWLPLYSITPSGKMLQIGDDSLSTSSRYWHPAAGRSLKRKFGNACGAPADPTLIGGTTHSEASV